MTDREVLEKLVKSVGRFWDTDWPEDSEGQAEINAAEVDLTRTLQEAQAYLSEQKVSLK